MEKSFEKKVTELMRLEEELEARKKALLARNLYQEKKKATGRQIRVGKLIESILDRALEEQDVSKISNYFNEDRKDNFIIFMNKE